MSRMPEVGDEVDDVFRIEEELDHGNFGAIYRVHDILEDRTLALKIHKPGPHDEDEVRQRFEREARLIYSLDHRNIVQVMYYGETGDGLPYMAMEFLEGTDLKQLLRGGYEFERAQIKRIALETLSALEAAHEVGIVHRDLKPANIFLVDDGQTGYVKVLDFGFAKALDDESAEEITRANTLVGSPAYMAPELVHKANVGPYSDLYAMGLIISEMITGEKTVQIEGVYDTIVFQGSDDPIELAPTVEHGPFGDIVQRAVHKDPERRYPTADDMLADLRDVDIDTDSADLQEHAEVKDEQSAPFVIGAADPDAETRPESHGMPPIEELDEHLDESPHAESNPAPDSGRHPAVEPGGARQDPRRTTGGMAPVEEDPAADRNQRATAGKTRVDPSPVPTDDRREPPTGQQSRQPTDRQPDPAPEPSSGGGSQKRTDNPGRHSTMPPTQKDELDLEIDEPPPRQRERHDPSLLREIMLGVALGGVALAIILAILFFIR